MLSSGGTPRRLHPRRRRLERVILQTWAEWGPGFFTQNNDRFVQLFNIVSNNSDLTDDEVKEMIYGASEKGGDSYRKLKSRLRRRLLNTIFVVDSEEQGGYSEYQKAFINCHKDWASVKLLQAYGCRATFIKLAKELLAASQKWQFTEITIMTAQVLSTAAAFNGSSKEQESYRKLTEKYFQQYMDEIKCQMDFDEIIVMLYQSKGQSPHTLSVTKNKLFSITNYAAQYPTVFKIQLLQKRVSFVLAELEGNINLILDSCEAGEALIAANPDFYNATIQAEFVLNHMLCYLRLKNYRQGITYYLKIRNLFQPGSGNFLTLQFYYTLSLIHAERFEEAALAFNQSAEHKLFKSQAKPMLVRWRLIEGALNYLNKDGFIRKTKLKSLQGKSFSILKLMNDIGPFAEDKAGVNMVLQSLYVAFMINEGKYKKVTELQSNFYSYITRYLKNNANQSAVIFLKLLNMLISKNYQVNPIPPKFKELQTKLEMLPPSASQDVTIDVLPFTWLWKAILKHVNKY